MSPKSSTTKNVALRLCVTAMFAAILVAGKAALAVIPNFEVVTLFVTLAAYVWGIGVAIPAVAAFIAVDVAIWGVNTWVISYVIHWNVVALSFWLLSKCHFNRKVTVVSATAVAVLLTVCFGVLTTAVDTLVGFTGQGFFLDSDSFGARFAAMYVSGIVFYAIQVATNLVLFLAAFFPLVAVNRKAKLRMFTDVKVTENEEIPQDGPPE